ncbi:hypothetical protein L1887_31522 [Cichorium endivia]|nr:hypothetical protein L1887_31522 [Cichorium endivia]
MRRPLPYFRGIVTWILSATLSISEDLFHAHFISAFHQTHSMLLQQSNNITAPNPPFQTFSHTNHQLITKTFVQVRKFMVSKPQVHSSNPNSNSNSNLSFSVK